MAVPETAPFDGFESTSGDASPRMFDAGFTELLLIMVIALLVVGPERLPGLARKVGLWIGKARTYFNSVRSDIERELRADELKRMLNQQQEEIQRLKTMVEDTGHELEKDLKDTEERVASKDETGTSTAKEEAPAGDIAARPESDTVALDGHPEDSATRAKPEEAPSDAPHEQRR